MELALEDPPAAAHLLYRDAYITRAIGTHESVEIPSGRDAFGHLRATRAVFRVTVRPPVKLARAGFPHEHLVIRVGPGQHRTILPAGPSRARSFKHLNGDGTLCLEMPDDPPSQLWKWEYGLRSFVYSGARHMWFEESNRRTGNWPVEDAPHGR